MGIVKAVWRNDEENTVALLTNIGFIPFENEGDQNTQDLINGFENGSHRLSLPWSTLSHTEEQTYYDDSINFWL